MRTFVAVHVNASDDCLRLPAPGLRRAVRSGDDVEEITYSAPHHV